MDEVYDVAQVCSNGHVATSMYQYGPQFRRDYCETCGEPTVTACPSCRHSIRGAYSGGIAGLPYRPPAFCPDCGKPFPWTERRLEAARELALEAEHLSKEEQRELAGTFDDLSRDVPRTQVAVIRFKRLAAKAGVGTANALRDILVDVASETAKKAIWG